MIPLPNDFGQLLLGLFLVLGIPLSAGLVNWRAVMLSVSGIKYVVALIMAFLTGSVPVFLAQWTPNDFKSWLAVVLAGLASAGAYHVPSPLQSAQRSTGGTVKSVSNP